VTENHRLKLGARQILTYQGIEPRHYVSHGVVPSAPIKRKRVCVARVNHRHKTRTHSANVIGVHVKAIAYLDVRSWFDPQPTAQNLLKARKLNDVVRHSPEEVVTADYLQPLELAATNFWQGEDIAGNVVTNCRAVKSR
jgi:hypothetical protein